MYKLSFRGNQEKDYGVRERVQALIEKVAHRFGTQADKVKHVVVSALLVLGFYVVLLLIMDNPVLANGLALCITLIIGFGKEFADKYTGGHRSRADMLANVIGAVPTALLIWLIQAILATGLPAFQ